MQDMKLIFGAEAISEETGIPATVLSSMADSGEFPAIKIAGSIAIRRTRLTEWISMLESAVAMPREVLLPSSEICGDAGTKKYTNPSWLVLVDKRCKADPFIPPSWYNGINFKRTSLSGWTGFDYDFRIQEIDGSRFSITSRTGARVVAQTFSSLIDAAVAATDLAWRLRECDRVFLEGLPLGHDIPDFEKVDFIEDEDGRWQNESSGLCVECLRDEDRLPTFQLATKCGGSSIEQRFNHFIECAEAAEMIHMHCGYRLIEPSELPSLYASARRSADRRTSAAFIRCFSCENCGNDFSPKHGSQKYCGSVCSSRANAERQRIKKSEAATIDSLMQIKQTAIS